MHFQSTSNVSLIWRLVLWMVKNSQKSSMCERRGPARGNSPFLLLFVRKASWALSPQYKLCVLLLLCCARMFRAGTFTLREGPSVSSSSPSSSSSSSTLVVAPWMLLVYVAVRSPFGFTSSVNPRRDPVVFAYLSFLVHTVYVLATKRKWSRIVEEEVVDHELWRFRASGDARQLCLERRGVDPLCLSSPLTGGKMNKKQTGSWSCQILPPLPTTILCPNQPTS